MPECNSCSLETLCMNILGVFFTFFVLFFNLHTMLLIHKKRWSVCVWYKPKLRAVIVEPYGNIPLCAQIHSPTFTINYKNRQV